MNAHRILLDPNPNPGGTLTEDPPGGEQTPAAPTAPNDAPIDFEATRAELDTAEHTPAPEPKAVKAPATPTEPAAPTEPTAPDEDPLLPKSVFKAPAPAPQPRAYVPTEAEKATFAARDYTAFSEEDRAFLKTQPNHVFDYAKKILPELYAARKAQQEAATQIETLSKKANGAIPDSYYENPEAFKLAPEYKQLSQSYELASFESNYCQQTLVAIEAGEQITPLNGYDQQGNPVYGQPRAATVQDKIKLQTALAQSEQNKQAILAQTGQLQQSFKQRHEAAINNLQAFAKQAMEILPAEFRPDKAEVDSFLEKKIAAERRHLPEAQLAANMWSTLLKQARFIAKLQAGQQTAVIAQATQKATGAARRPTATAPTAASSNSKTINFTAIREELDEITADS